MTSKKMINKKLIILGVLLIGNLFLSDFALADNCPAITTVSGTTVIFVGELSDTGGDSSNTVWFEYGQSQNYGLKTYEKILSQAGIYCITVSNLLPCTTYHYRAAARNDAGTSYGSNKSFTTTCGPTVDLKANGSNGPVNVSYNGSIVLSWSSDNTNSCQASGGWFGQKSISGSENISNLTNSVTYTIACTGVGDTASDSVTVNVAGAGSPNLSIHKTVRNINDNTGFKASVSAEPLDQIEFKIIIQSIGTTTAQNVTVKDALPAGLNYKGDLEINGLVWGGSIISGLNIGDLSAGVTKTITFKTKLDSETNFDYGTKTLVNTVSAGADGLSKVYDSAIINVTRQHIGEPEKELSVEKKVRNLTSGHEQWYETVTASPSDKIIFQIKVTNTGNTHLSDIIVKDGLPGKISWHGELEIDNKASSADIVKGINIRDLSVGHEKIITFEALVAGKDEFIYGTTDLINTVMAYNTNDSDTDTAKVQVQRVSVAGAVTEIPTGVLDSLVISFGVTVLISYCFLLGHFFYQKTGMNLGGQIARKRTSAQNWYHGLTIFDSPEKSEKRFQKITSELRKKEL